MMVQMVLCKASRNNVAGCLLSILCNWGCPTGRFWEVILKTGAYGESVVSGWHGLYLGKLTLCQEFPKRQLLFSPTHHWKNLKSHFHFFLVSECDFYTYSTGSIRNWLNREIGWYSRGIFVLDTIAYQITILPNSRALIIHFMRSNEVLWDGCLSVYCKILKPWVIFVHTSSAQWAPQQAPAWFHLNFPVVVWRNEY